MISNEELKMLSRYFSDIEVPEGMETLVKKLQLIETIQIADEKLQELIKESNK